MEGNLMWTKPGIFLLFVTLISKVQKFPEVLQTNTSGVPSRLLFSIRISEID